MKNSLFIFFSLPLFLFSSKHGIHTTKHDNSNEKNFYFVVNHETILRSSDKSSISFAGSLKGDTFAPFTSLKNKILLLPYDKNIKIKIENYEVLDTEKEDFKYLIIQGIDIDQDDNTYLIAFPISNNPDQYIKYAENHTCKSSSNFAQQCQTCEFKKDKEGKIIGCKCKSNILGICEHTISTQVDFIIE